MIREDHFCKGFVMREGHPSRVAAGVSLLHQLEITNHVLVVKWIAVKLFEQVEGDVRFVLHQRITNYVELIVESDWVDLMSHSLQRGTHVVLSFYFDLFFITEAIERIGWDEILMHQNNDAELFFGFECHRAVQTAIR